MRTIGVIGGLGPAATADFFTRLVERTPATCDQEHIHLLIDNDPGVPNRNDGIFGTGPSPGPRLAEMAAGLEAAGASALVMPCNAAHAFAAQVRAAVSIPLLSIIEVCVEATLATVHDPDAVSILASSGCVHAELYQRAFHARGVRTIVPHGEQMERFMDALTRFKASGEAAGSREAMLTIAREHIARGAVAVVAGCTEVPMILAESDPGCPLVASTDALVDATIAFAFSE